MEELPVVPFDREKHEAPFFAFLEKVLGAGKFANRKKALIWYHEQMPLRERLPHRHVVMDGERVAGSMGHMPADYVIKGERIQARITHDLLVDPDYRGKGLAKKLVTNAAQTGDFFPGGFWMNEPCYKIHLSCGFDDVLAPVTQTLVLDPSTFVTRKGLSVFKRGVTRIALDLNRRRALRKSSGTIKRSVRNAVVDAADEFDPSFDHHWARMTASYGITAHREAAGLNWKYAGHPVLKYQLLIVTFKKETRGFFIWRRPLEGDGDQRAVIVDYLVERGDNEAFELLLSRVITEAVDHGVESLSILTAQPWAIKLLRSYGFFARRGAHTWVVAGWRDRIPAGWLSDHDPWHICLGDSDGDYWSGSQ